MIIIPAPPPIALADQNNINQGQQNQAQLSEQSRKATDTVRISSKAQELAGSETRTSPEQKANTHIAKQAIESEIINQQQAVNPLTNQPDNNKIDVVI